MPQPGDGREWTEHWRGQRARSPSTPVAYFMCSPQESRASHQNWSRYGDRSFCCPPWPGNICTREKQSPESLVSKLNKETISDLKQGKFPCCCCPNDCSTPTASSMHRAAPPEYETQQVTAEQKHHYPHQKGYICSALITANITHGH